AIPNYTNALYKSEISLAIGDINFLENEIMLYRMDYGKLPDSLDDIGRGNFLDPWGRPYRYLNFDNVKGKGKMRKDRFLVPLNSDYDLYSVGKDGKTATPLNAKISYDDVVRANDGGFIGLGKDY
ncbi:MAG: prepilin-type cleavage/methylation domain-containing protein, partial [Candidatus Aminicenantes bacterium]|nr:prepilin-type cleavage/methylation domain-containing protein [Candidatus Aminicenantes bacterium]